MKTLIGAIVVLALIAVGAYVYTTQLQDTGTGDETPTATDTIESLEDRTEGIDTSEAVLNEQEPAPTTEPTSVLGTSVEGRDITAYHFGTGESELLFVGGIHGGYSWNTALVAYELIDYLEANPDAVPENVKVTVVPVLNPDGQNSVVGSAGRFSSTDVPASEAERIPGRFNANEVDLNRNFDCEWQEEGVWQSRTVSGGSSAFSEPEAQAIRDYVEANTPTAVVVWYSAAGGVYASNCNNGVLPETTTIMNLYADASGYPAHQEFDYYEITGDMVNWLAGEGIPGISVLLTNHQDTEWSKNKAGIEALLSHYSSQ